MTGVERAKSTSIANELEEKSFVLMDGQISERYDENLDVSNNQSRDQHEENNISDILSYNQDAHEHERLSPVDPPGPSFSDETITEPILHNIHPQSEQHEVVQQVEATRPSMLSYNHDAHDHERLLSVDPPGSSLSGEGVTQLTHHNVHPQSEQQVEVTRPNNNKMDKVYILHFTDDDDISSQDAILQLASSLRHLHVDVTLDLFEKDKFHGNWHMWHEKKLTESKIVLCIITEHFYNGLTSDHVKGYSAYNLMSDGKIPFIPIFLESKVDKNHIPLSMRGHNFYPINLRDIPKENKIDRLSKNFENLYSFLTGQNRAQAPTLGEVISVPLRKSVMSEEGRIVHENVMSEEERTFLQLNNVTTSVMSLPSHNRMFMQLASNLTTEWEPLGRTLGVSEANIYAIKRDNAHSVTEQAVKMFQQWLRQNGSAATIQVLATAVYESGSKYWQLLTVLCKYAL